MLQWLDRNVRSPPVMSAVRQMYVYNPYSRVDDATYEPQDGDALGTTRRSTRHVAEGVPPELWLRIFEFATFVPGILDIDIDDPFTAPRTTLPLAEFDWEDLSLSFATGSSIIRVSRTWYSLGLPFLYRVVALYDDDARVLRLRDTLAKSVERGDDPPLGSFVRHLILGRPEPDNCFGRARSCDLITSIISHTNNLDILSIMYQNQTESLLHSYIPTILSYSTLHPTLKKIYIHPDMRPYLPQGTSLPHGLRTFVTGEYEYGARSLGPTDLLALPNISFLAVASPPRPRMASTDRHTKNNVEETPLPRPSLTKVLFIGHAQTISHFLHVQGEYLTYIQLDVRVMYSKEISRAMELFADDCPALTHLVFSSLAYDRKGMPHRLTLPTTITHLGFNGYLPADLISKQGSHKVIERSRQESESLFRCLADSAVEVSGLRVVRFLDTTGPRVLKELAQMRYCLHEVWSGRGSFRVEDWDGREFSTRPI